MKKRPITFQVTGKGVFPFDMLRYDGCYPMDTGSAQLLPETVLRTIKLVAPDGHCTEGRWNSFLWSVEVLP